MAVSIHKSQVTEAKKKVTMVHSCNKSGVDEKKGFAFYSGKANFPTKLINDFSL